MPPDMASVAFFSTTSGGRMVGFHAAEHPRAHLHGAGALQKIHSQECFRAGSPDGEGSVIV